MGKAWRTLWVLFTAAACVATATQNTPPKDGQPLLVIAHATVIDVRDGSLLADRSISIRGDRIVDISVASAPVPDGARVIDATGKFVIPGLWDMHVHTFFGDLAPDAEAITVPLFVANGITGVRDMGSDLEPILQLRSAIAAGRTLGPRMVIAGPMLDGPKTQFPASIPIATPQDGRRAVDLLADRGVDFIKIQSYVPREAYFAIAEEAKRRQIVFVGHVPDAVRASEAAAVGQKSFEHLIGIFEGSSPDEDAFLTGVKGPGKFLQTYEAPREAKLVELLFKDHVWQCPTLFWERGQWLVDDIDVSRDPNGIYAPVSWHTKTWPKFTAGIIKDLDTDPLAVRKRFVEHELEIVKRLYDRGVPLLAGTDTPAGVDVLPGFSLHQELQRFVDAGLSPLAALQTATINPARFLGKLDDLGTVERGKLADLVVLNSNPLLEIANTQSIDSVIANGRYLPRADLDALLHGVAAAASRTHRQTLP